MSEMVSTFDLLSDDTSGQGLKQIQEELFDMRSGLKRSMDAGLTADDMQKARTVLSAVDAADEAAHKLYSAWNR